jgi:hypothetical protein
VEVLEPVLLEQVWHGGCVLDELGDDEGLL